MSNTSKELLITNRRKGIFLSDEHLSQHLADLSPAEQLLERTLIRLEQRESASTVLGEFKKSAKSVKFQTPEEQATVNFIEAIARNRLGQPRLAIAALRKIHALEQTSLPGYLIIDTLCEEGVIYTWQGSRDKAISKYLLALNYALEQQDQVRQALIWSAVARLHLELLQYEQALQYFNSALTLVASWETSRERLRLIKDMAETHLGLSNPKQAQQLLDSISEDELTSLDDYLQFIILGLRLQSEILLGGQYQDLLEQFSDRCNEDDDYQVAHLNHLTGLSNLTSQPNESIQLLNNASAYYQENKLTVPHWKTTILLIQSYQRLDDKIQARQKLSIAFELASELHSSLLYEKTLMVQKDLQLPDVLVDEQDAIITTQASISADGYTLLKPLGEGAFGKVYHAYDALRDRDVAIKKFNLNRIYDSRRREAVVDNIRRELKATAQLNHPGILQLIAYGLDENNEPYVVMPLITGISLRQWLREQQSHTAKLNLIVKVLFALSVAHDADVVHRDLKPENIMLNDQDEPVIVDFGISSFEATECDPANSVGTLPYMAPEHHLGKPADSAMDIFAVGVILFELFTGEWPWKEQCPSNRLSYRFTLNRIKTTLINEGIDAKLAYIISTMLHYNPQKRPAADYLGAKLPEFLET